MRVGMEHALDQRHLQEGVGAPLGEIDLVELAGLKPDMVVEEDAGQELLHQHPLGGPFPEDLGKHDVVATEELRRQPLAIARLVGEVELAVDALRELAHLLLRPVAPHLLPFALDDARAMRHQPEIGLDDPPQSRAQHLDDDLFARMQPCLVDLGDRGRGDGRLVEFGEDLFRRSAEVLLELRTDLGPGHGRDLGVQLAELVGPFGAEQVGAGRHDLAELDEGRPQRLDGAAHALRLGEARDIGTRRIAGRDPGDDVQPQLVEDLGEAVAQEHAGDDEEAAAVAGSHEGGFQHGLRLYTGRVLNGVARVATSPRSGGVMSSPAWPGRGCAAYRTRWQRPRWDGRPPPKGGHARGDRGP